MPPLRGRRLRIHLPLVRQSEKLEEPSENMDWACPHAVISEARGRRTPSLRRVMDSANAARRTHHMQRGTPRRRLSRRRRLSDASADAREVRRAKAAAQRLQRKHKAGGDQGVDKVSGELGKKFDKRLAKEKIEDLRVASNIEASGEDAILAASRANKAPAVGTSASSELTTKLRRRRQSMGEEVMTSTTGKSGTRGDDKSRGVAREKEREKREKEGIADVDPYVHR